MSNSWILRWNGRLSPMLMFLFLVFAISFSSIATFDCRFVSIKTKMNGSSLINLKSTDNSRQVEIANDSSTTIQGIGFFVWEGSNGKCDVEETSDDFLSYHMYQEFLGPDWRIPQIMACASLVLAFISAICTVLYYCMMPNTCVQYALALMFVIVLPILQSIPLTISHSDFCDEYSCVVGRSAQYAVCAIFLYIAVGLSLLPRIPLCKFNDAI